MTEENTSLAEGQGFNVEDVLKENEALKKEVESLNKRIGEYQDELKKSPKIPEVPKGKKIYSERYVRNLGVRIKSLEAQLEAAGQGVSHRSRIRIGER